jgi:hypothetical protein
MRYIFSGFEKEVGKLIAFSRELASAIIIPRGDF